MKSLIKMYFYNRQLLLISLLILIYKAVYLENKEDCIVIVSVLNSYYISA